VGAPHEPGAEDAELGHAPRLDPGGVAILTAGLSLLLYPLVAGRDAGWPAWTWACLLATAPLLALFVRFERWKAARDGSPLIDLDLFRDRPFVVGLLLVLLFGAANAAFFLVIALYLQLGRGFSALTAGATFAWAAFGVFVAAMLSVRLAPRLGARLIAFGLVAKALAWLTMLTLVARAGVTLPPAALVPALFVEGFGAGCTVAPLIGAILAGTRADHVGAASGVLTTVQQVAGALGVALIGIVFFATLAGHARVVGPALAPDLRRQLAATGAGPAAVDATVADFVACVAERGAARDPAVAPPSCARPTLRPADSTLAAPVATALARANAATYARAFAVAMGANAGALALALLLLRFLPAPRSPAHD
jgi:hypothetical protein